MSAVHCKPFVSASLYCIVDADCAEAHKQLCMMRVTTVEKNTFQVDRVTDTGDVVNTEGKAYIE